MLGISDEALSYKIMDIIDEYDGALEHEGYLAANKNVCEDIKKLLEEAVLHELEQQRHLIQDDSHDKWCERCQHPSSYSCVTTNYKIDRRIKELRLDNDQCELCGAKPMTTNCNNGRCDD